MAAFILSTLEVFDRLYLPLLHLIALAGLLCYCSQKSVMIALIRPPLPIKGNRHKTRQLAFVTLKRKGNKKYILETPKVMAKDTLKPRIWERIKIQNTSKNFKKSRATNPVTSTERTWMTIFKKSNTNVWKHAQYHYV